MKAIIVLLLAGFVAAHAGTPQLKAYRVSGWYPYSSGVIGGSNEVIVVYKSTYLGTGMSGEVWTPFKRTVITPASRTSAAISLLPGSYKFYATALVQPYGESDPSPTTPIFRANP